MQSELHVIPASPNGGLRIWSQLANPALSRAISQRVGADWITNTSITALESVS